MFNVCTSLTEIDVSNWNTGNVQNMSYIFSGCTSLTEIDVSNWNTHNVQDMSAIFMSCTSLTGIDVSNWNTDNVRKISFMFMGCTSLTEIDVSNWNTDNVQNISYMFFDSTNLKMIRLGLNFNFLGTEAEIPNINQTDIYTGYWEKVEDQDHPYWTSEELMSQYYGSKDAGTYVWQERLIGTDITVNYVDEDGKEIASPETLTGKLGDTYQANQKDITNYTFKEVKDNNETGVFTDKEQTVTYVYTKNAAANITVNYIDEDGKEIASPETLTGKLGDTYKANQKDITNYTFKEVKYDNEIGVFTDKEQTVTYVYTKNEDKVTPTEDKKGDNGTTTNTTSTNASDSNQKGKLPSTGDQNIIPLTLIGSFFAALSAAIFALKRKKD